MDTRRTRRSTGGAVLRSWVAMVVATLTLAACGPSASAPPRGSAPPPAEPGAIEVLGTGVERVTPAAAGDVSALTAAQTAFALDLYDAVREQVDGDLVVGPMSLHTVLAMVRAGARGETATEMDAVLHADGVDLHGAGNALDRAVQERNGATGVDLTSANRVWLQRGMALTDEYIATIAGNYDAGLAATDFIADPEAARTAVNGWVAERTRDKITDLFPRGSIDTRTRLVLANAVHLDAAWKFPFDPARTDDQPFTLPDGTEVDVPTMHYDQDLPTAIGPGWAAVELPYDGEQLSMTIIVPQDLAAFEQRLDAGLLDGILGQVTDGGIHLSLPRFRARTHLGLSDTLVGMGMPTAFGPGADLSGMTGQSGLWLHAVEHEAVVEVDEEGTEAAAASGASIAGSHGPTVTVDRPFLFLVRDEPTGALLFLGRVTDPR